VAKLTRLTYKIAIQLHVVAENCTICFRRPVRKLLDTPSYLPPPICLPAVVLIKQWVPGALSLEMRRPGCVVDHSPPSGAGVGKALSCASTVPIHPHGVVLSWSTGTLRLSLHNKEFKTLWWQGESNPKRFTSPSHLWCFTG
jgi:hypothetical protein